MTRLFKELFLSDLKMSFNSVEIENITS